MIVRTLEAFLSSKGALLTFFAQSGLQLPKPDPVRPPIRLTDEDIGEVVRDRVKMIKNRYTLHTVCSSRCYWRDLASGILQPYCAQLPRGKIYIAFGSSDFFV